MLKLRLGREWAVMALCAFDSNPPGNLEAALGEFWELLKDAELDALQNQAENVYRKADAVAVFTSSDADILKRVDELKAFAEKRIRGVLAERDAIDAVIEPFIDNWKIYRIGLVERNVLRLGVWEIKLCGESVPPPVAINEAVDIAKYFSSTASGKFVNAVLDHYCKSECKTPQ